MWPEHQQARAPVQDFPPRWASAWGDDPYGLWADCTVAAQGQAQPVVQRLRWIEPGTFIMGSDAAERKRIQDKGARAWANQVEFLPHPVAISEGFWLADTPCTQALWQAVMGSNPSYFGKGPDAPRRPVERVAFDHPIAPKASVQVFLQRVQALLPAGVQASLPTEAQWEYACRAGTRTAYWWGDEWDDHRGNVDKKNKGTTPVDKYPPNPWGLHDIHGNVWEWTQSPWRRHLDDVAATEDMNRRALRGGSWIGPPGGARSAFRLDRGVGWLDLYYGFRFLLRSSSTSASTSR